MASQKMKCTHLKFFKGVEHGTLTVPLQLISSQSKYGGFQFSSGMLTEPEFREAAIDYLY